MSREEIGPELPPGFNANKDDENEEIGPELPPGFNVHKDDENEEIGPELPPGFNANKDDENEEIGPELPPGFNVHKDDENDEIGPELPPGFNANKDDDDDDDDSEDDFIGPRPPGMNDVADEVSGESLFEFKCRMTEKRRHHADTEDSSARPEWMTKVPRDRTGAFGTGARSFRMTSAPEVDSSWEEKGGHVCKHKRQKEPAAQPPPPPPQKVQRVEANPAQQHRQKSLLEEHMELMKKGKAKTMSDEPPPGYWSGMDPRGAEKKNAYFDRERDFGAAQMDPTQLKKTLESMGRLKDSFSSAGKSNKFM